MSLEALLTLARGGLWTGLILGLPLVAASALAGAMASFAAGRLSIHDPGLQRALRVFAVLGVLALGTGVAAQQLQSHAHEMWGALAKVDGALAVRDD